MPNWRQAHVAYWHETDMALQSPLVRCRGTSGLSPEAVRLPKLTNCDIAVPFQCASLSRYDAMGAGEAMKRREFITLLGGAAALPLTARAQQPAKMKRIAMVHPSDPIADMVASYRRSYRGFFDELSHLDFVEGKNLVVERYSAGGQFDRIAQLARDVVGVTTSAHGTKRT
jgi:hypothetical protein